MATINKIDCLNGIGNTGVGACYLDYKMIAGSFLVPKGDEVDVATLQDALQAKTHMTSKSKRWYKIDNFVQPTDSTEQKVEQKFATGASAVVREGFNSWMFQYISGGLSLMKQLRKMNGDSHDFIFFDVNNMLMGIPGSTATKLKGIPSNGGRFWAGPWKMNDGSKVSDYQVEFVFPVRYSNDYVAAVQADFDISSTINSLQDVVLSSTINATAGSYNVKAETLASLSNLGDLYSTELAASGMWTAVNGVTGAVITISSVTFNATIGEFVLALLTTDTDYPATAGAILLNLNTPTVLANAGIDGYESTGAISVAATTPS